MSGALDAERHVLILTSSGSYTVAGRRLTDPVDTAEKLGKLITWAVRKHGALQPIGGPDHSLHPARVWATGDAVALLAGAPADPDDDPADRMGRVLAPLVDGGWELRGGPQRTIVLGHGQGTGRMLVEVLAEQRPWLAAGDASIANDAVELGRRVGRWYAELGMLPSINGALTGAGVADHVMAGRRGGRGVTVTAPGLLPGWATPEFRVQPPWSASTEQVERELQHCDELVRLTQQSPALASAGMLTLGHGQPRALDAAAAIAAATAPRRPFGLWLVELPAAAELDLPDTLPLPHPQMAAGCRVQAWVSTEDLDGLAKDVRDGGAGLPIDRLAITEAVVWPHKTRILEAWSTRLRQAREHFADDPALLGLVDAAASDYLAALADPSLWADEAMRHHFQPAWAAAIAAHVRLRGRRAATRISREYHAWPLYVDGTSLTYGPSTARGGAAPIDLSDSHTRLGRLVVTAHAALSDQTIVELLFAESPDAVSAALTAALGPAPATPHCLASIGAAQTNDEPPTDRELPVDRQVTEIEPGERRDDQTVPAATSAEDEPPARRAPGGRPRVARLGGTPAAVLHVDGLWLNDGTRHDVPESVVHVGHVAELAYAHDLGYQLSPGYAEPGQIWITEEACRSFGVDVEAVLEKKPKDRTTVLREVTHDIPFVVDALADGWQLGGGGDTGSARLGTWTRVYSADQKRKGVWIVLIVGMASPSDGVKDVDNVPVLVDGPGEEGGIDLSAPPTIARRLKLLADALRFPMKINPGVTAIDLMKQTRPKGTTIEDWVNGPLAPSTFDLPFTVNDVERDFNWTRPPTADEGTCRYVHAYDRGGSYPAALAGLELPIGDPVHHPDGSVFEDPAMLAQLIKAPGLATIVVPDVQEWRVPFLLNPAGLHFTGPKPTTTARLDRALRQGYEVTIVEAYTWPNHGRVLNGFYERVRDASVTLDTDDPDDQAARAQSKVVRNVAIGLMGSEPNLKGKTGYDPMKRLSIVGKASANIAYRLDQIGESTQRWPVAVEKDTVVYVSDDPNPRTAWPGGEKTWGRGFGQYKHEGSALLADHVGFLDGGSYKGKAALLDPDEWAELSPTLAAPLDAKAGS